MNIDIKDTLTLSDNNKYVVASKTSYNNKIYYYLIDPTNYANIKFCEEDKNELIEIKDKETIKKLLPLFIKAARNVIKEIQEEQN